ncbi:MAG: hypothetical protein WBA12_00255 [Catalinimonas sp.]
MLLSRLWSPRHPEVIQRNREPARAHFVPDAASARTLDPARSTRRLLLHGTWKFRWLERLEAAPEDFAAPAYADSAWTDLPVCPSTGRCGARSATCTKA